MSAPATTIPVQHALTAMAIWEEMVDPVSGGGDTPWQALRDNIGAIEMRNMILDVLAGPCSDAWDRAWQRYEKAHDAWGASLEGRNPNTEPEEPGALDYDYVPAWLQYAVDWSNPSGYPTIKTGGDCGG